MIRLASLYNEIKLFSSNQYPKNKRWSKEVKSYGEQELLMKILESLGYKWQSGIKPTVFQNFTFPIIIHNNYLKDQEGILTWTNPNLREIKIIKKDTPESIADLIKLFPKVNQNQKREIFQIIRRYVYPKNIKIGDPLYYKNLPSFELRNLYNELLAYKQKYLDKKNN